jgi:hypothetical protein
MSLILFYITFMVGGALAAYFLGLLVEYEWGPHVSLIVFLTVYFCALWVSWVLAVWDNQTETFRTKCELRIGLPLYWPGQNIRRFYAP